MDSWTKVGKDLTLYRRLIEYGNPEMGELGNNTFFFEMKS